MKCLKGGNICKFLTGLKSHHHHLCAISITITNIEYKHMILHGISDSLTTFAAQTLMSLIIASKYMKKPVDMSELINMISTEADRVKMKMHCALKDQAQNKGKKAGQMDEALAATSTYGSSNNNHSNRKCCNGKCYHCSREGHWVHECHTKKK